MSKSSENGFRHLVLIGAFVLSVAASIAAQTDPLESALIRIAADSEHAVLGVSYAKESDPAHFANVVGSALSPTGISRHIHFETSRSVGSQPNSHAALRAAKSREDSSSQWSFCLQKEKQIYSTFHRPAHL